MITATIIDDKPVNATTLQTLIQNYCPAASIAGMAHNIEDAHLLINQCVPDVVFLDIEMPGGGGFDLLRRFESIPFEVVFTTAYNQYAIEAFRINALDYLLKPINIFDLQNAVAKAERQISLKKSNEQLSKCLKTLQILTPNKLSLPTKDGYMYVSHQDIIRCEASGSYTNFYMNSGKKITVSMLLKKCEDLLPVELFVRTHNSHIINIQFVKQYIRGRGGLILMQDGSSVEVAFARKSAFLDMMNKQY